MNRVPTSINKHRRRIGFVSLAMVCAVAALAAPRVFEPTAVPSDDAAQVGPRGRSHAIPHSMSASASPAPCSFSPGQRMAFEIDTRTKVDVDLAGVIAATGLGGSGVQAQASQAQRSEIDRHWQLELEAIELADDGSAIMAARIRDLGMRAQVDGGQQPRASARLSDTFLVVLESRCAIREFGWLTAGDLDAAREQQQLVAGLGFWTPPSEAGAHYEAASFDWSGDYDVRFHVSAEGRIAGEFTNYRRAQGSTDTLQFDTRVLSSGIAVELADASWFASLDNHRELELWLSDTRVGTHARNTEAHAIATSSWRANVELDDRWSFGRLWGSGSERGFDPALVGVELDDALAHYRELLASGASLAVYGGYLRDWLRANPEGAEQLLEQLAAGSFDSQFARAGVFHALASAGTPESRRVLVDVVDGATGRTAHRIAAAQALAQVDEPDLDMVATLAKHAHNGEIQAIERGSIGLALGAFAHEAEAHDPLVAAAAREEIRGWLSAPSSAEQLEHSLLAAGNTGHDELVDAVAPYLGHDDANVRKSAARAMRSMSPELAYPQLERIADDLDQTVRAQALASAAQVCARGEEIPSEALLGAAERALAGGALEQRNAVELLRAASAQGNERARASLDARLQAELASEAPNPTLVAALGRSLPRTWTANN